MIKKRNILVLSVTLILTFVLNSTLVFAKGSYDLNVAVDENDSNGNFVPTYKYVKVFYQNDADAKATIKIQNEDGDKTYDSFIVDANSPKRSNKTMILSADTEYSFKVIMSDEDINPAGTFILKSASSKGELE